MPGSGWKCGRNQRRRLLDAPQQRLGPILVLVPKKAEPFRQDHGQIRLIDRNMGAAEPRFLKADRAGIMPVDLDRQKTHPGIVHDSREPLEQRPVAEGKDRPFDMYLVDEVTAVGDAAFRRETSELLKARLGQAGAIVVSHAPAQLRGLCSAGAVLESGRLRMFDDLDEAIAVYQAGVQAMPQARAPDGLAASGGVR